jgi:outer membrane lipoprotein
MKKPHIFMLLLLLLFLTGCAHLISDQSLALVDRSVTFDRLRENPDAFRGRFVLLGGSVASLAANREGSQLEVEQHALDDREVPKAASGSGGHFLATTPYRLDPADYPSGTLVSMVGEVTGTRVERDYRYPVIAVREIRAIAPPAEETYRTWGAIGGF